MSQYTLFPFSLGDLKIFIIPQLEDNYTYLIPYGDKGILVDPEENKLYELLESRGLELTHILTTHHHSDHIGANTYLKKKTGCQILGPDDSRIPGLSKVVEDGEDFSIGPFRFKGITKPGHTKSHMVYLVGEIVFCGDVLFGAGCGRIFEGSYEEMFSSLVKLCFLNKDTLIFCGHEYTEKNLRFAISLEEENKALKERYEITKQLAKKKMPSVPSSLKLKSHQSFFKGCKP
jgi:hydroxyacylglutathione hydrolase